MPLMIISSYLSGYPLSPSLVSKLHEMLKFIPNLLQSMAYFIVPLRRNIRYRD